MSIYEYSAVCHKELRLLGSSADCEPRVSDPVPLYSKKMKWAHFHSPRDKVKKKIGLGAMGTFCEGGGVSKTKGAELQLLVGLTSPPHP